MSDILSKFMNIWEVKSHFKCPIIGAMLSVEKHKNILKKCGYNVKEMKPYEYHQQIMIKLHDKNHVSVKVNNYILNIARKLMIRINGLPDHEIRSLWKKQLKKGNVGPMMYAIVSYKNTDMELLQDVYGEVHMQAHANMTEIFHIRQKQRRSEEILTQMQKKITLKNEEFKTLSDIRKADKKKIALLKAENLTMQTRITELEKTLYPKSYQENTTRSLELKITDLEQCIKNEQKKLRIKEREKKSIQIELFSVRNKNELMKEEIQSLVEGFKLCASPGCTEKSNCQISGNCTENTCPRYQLCAKRIFMIGGLTKMESLYRKIVETAGGEFNYHDGYMKNAHTNLKAKVKQCDVVLCPVNCNSHGACLKVKKLCNRYNKQLKILNSSSLSAVSQALFIPENEARMN
ncbi:DUF2325 domain-containing protein [Desulfobacula toluolica]|uniref:Conserved uncharacterized protein n=1 Tax=Desulfobacula toluolica (strain DSM 7467 / Tol2) TaxID=651182 RepID=K0NN83_DESTT|nr:DUF2325 domain-containing protein [Desulfobacula toluolica]CCK81473.1 conserved uncharacterized protein [Desulfobacula toluolica Tol2]